MNETEQQNRLSKNTKNTISANDKKVNFKKLSNFKNKSKKIPKNRSEKKYLSSKLIKTKMNIESESNNLIDKIDLTNEMGSLSSSTFSSN